MGITDLVWLIKAWSYTNHHKKKPGATQTVTNLFNNITKEEDRSNIRQID
jgi:hypothetical protein